MDADERPPPEPNAGPSSVDDDAVRAAADAILSTFQLPVAMLGASVVAKLFSAGYTERDAAIKSVDGMVKKMELLPKGNVLFPGGIPQERDLVVRALLQVCEKGLGDEVDKVAARAMHLARTIASCFTARIKRDPDARLAAVIERLFAKAGNSKLLTMAEETLNHMASQPSVGHGPVAWAATAPPSEPSAPWRSTVCRLRVASRLVAAHGLGPEAGSPLSLHRLFALCASGLTHAHAEVRAAAVESTLALYGVARSELVPLLQGLQLKQAVQEALSAGIARAEVERRGLAVPAKPPKLELGKLAAGGGGEGPEGSQTATTAAGGLAKASSRPPGALPRASGPRRRRRRRGARPARRGRSCPGSPRRGGAGAGSVLASYLQQQGAGPSQASGPLEPLARDFAALRLKVAPGGRITPELLVCSVATPPHPSEAADKFLARATHLSLNDKRIEQISGLRACPALQVLYLYDNLIQRVEGLDGLSRVTKLYLQGNSISRMEGLSGLPLLTALHLDKNCIPRLEGLENCLALEELSLSGQRLPPGVRFTFERASLLAISESLVSLECAGNNACDISALSALRRVETLNLARNGVDDLEGALQGLEGCRSVRRLCLQGSPVAHERHYRENVVVACPSLEELDEREITPQERQFATRLQGERLRRAATTHARHTRADPRRVQHDELEPGHVPGPSSAPSSSEATGRRQRSNSLPRPAPSAPVAVPAGLRGPAPGASSAANLYPATYHPLPGSLGAVPAPRPLVQRARSFSGSRGRSNSGKGAAASGRPGFGDGGLYELG
eukprot:tig00020960_g16531.t1